MKGTWAHTLFAWGAMLGGVGIASIISLGLMSRAVVCTMPYDEHPFLSFFCEFRGISLSMVLITLFLLIIVAVFAASYDLAAPIDKGSAQSPGPHTVSRNPGKGARAIWRNKRTPHRLKTLWTAIAWGVLTLLFYYIVAHARIAFK